MHFILVLRVTQKASILVLSISNWWGNIFQPCNSNCEAKRTESFSSMKNINFLLKVIFPKDIQQTKMKNWQRLTWKIAFGENQNFLPSVPSCFFSHAIYIYRENFAASITPHLWTPVLAPTASCSLTFPKHQLLQGVSTTGYKEATELSLQRPKRGTAEALSSIIMQLWNYHFTAKWVMPEYIQVALSVIYRSSATLNIRQMSWPEHIKRKAKICSDLLPRVCCSIIPSCSWCGSTQAPLPHLQKADHPHS